MVVPRTEATYTYTQLSALLHTLRTSRDKKVLVNIWALIIEATAPRPTKGTDLVQNVYIRDPSLAVEEGQETTPEQDMLRGGVEVMVFSRQESSFPQATEGDIIRFHRLDLNEYHGKVQLVAQIGRGRGCQYCLFDKGLEALLEPRQRSSDHYTMTQADRQNLQMLREFQAHHGGGQGGPSKYLFSIHDAEPGTFVDIICRVVAVEDQGSRHEVFYVWDGTDARPFDISMDRRKASVEADSPPGSSASHPDDVMLCRRLPPYMGGGEGSGLVPDFPEMGSTLPVNLYKPVESRSASAHFPHLQGQPLSLPELPALGRWVKLKNVLVVVVEGQLQALYTSSSKWIPWREMPPAMKEKYDQRAKSDGFPEWGPAEDSDRVIGWPSQEEEDVQVTFLRQILMGAGSGERKRFKCFVRVVDYLPKEPAAFCRRHKGGWQFCVRLLLEDATAELDATLVGKHGSEFFRGCPEMDLSTLPEYQAALRRTMQGCTTFRHRTGGEWLGCCIERIYPDPSNSQENVDAKYRLVSTTLEAIVDELA